MASYHNRFLRSVSLSVLAIGVFTVPVYAGFEWTPPVKQPEPPAQIMPAVPLDVVKPEPIPEKPQVIEDAPTETSAAPQELTPIADMEEPVIEEPEVAMPVAEDAPEEKYSNKAIQELLAKQEAADNEAKSKAQEPQVTSAPETAPEEETITIDLSETPEEIQPAAVEKEEEPKIEEIAVKAEEMKNAEPVTELIIDPTPQLAQEPEAAEEEIVEEQVIQPNKQKTELEITPYPVETEKQEVAQTQSTKSQENIFWNEPETFDVIEGFGSDIPLALALRQIVPAQYAFSFGPGANPGMIVSWEGGKPWNEVLKETLSPINVGFGINEKTLILHGKEAKLTNDIQKKTEKTDIGPENEVTSTDTLLQDEKNIAPETISVSETDIMEDMGKELVQTEPDTTSETIESKEVAAEEPKTKAIQKKDITWLTQTDAHAQSADIAAPLAEIVENDGVISEPKIVEMANNGALKKGNTIIAPPPPKNLPPEPAAIEIVKKADAIAEQTTESIAPQSKVVAAEEAPVEPKRISIKDPGPVETTQPKIINIPQDTPKTTEQSETKVAEEIEPTENSAPLKEVDVATLNTEVIPQKVPAEPEEEILFIENVAPTQPEGNFRAEPSKIIRVWQAKKGANLQKTLTDWSAQENVKFSWNTETKYRLSKDVFISGTFENAINILFSKGLKDAPNHALKSDGAYGLQISD